jgi:uncharacterized Zn finger protein
MDQTPATSGALHSQGRYCPECESTQTKPTVATARGFYCRCEGCGHVWHEDTKGNAPLDN